MQQVAATSELAYTSQWADREFWQESIYGDTLFQIDDAFLA
jgi:hypothetical protein